MLLIAAVSCKGNIDPEPVHEQCNAVYYWKTVFHPDSADLAFLSRHDVERIYLRMFDVVEQYEGGSAVPNATVRISDADYALIRDSLSAKEFVPVVYITLEGLTAMEGRERELAAEIVDRVRNMVSYNELPNVAELQLDCDWTGSTREQFFSLCRAAREHIAVRELPWRLSATIRLHQLDGEVPPVDNGVLMVYNTGCFDDPDDDNSIISADDVKPYLKNISSYPLYLDVAYPTYSWQLVFRDREFLGLADDIDTVDTTIVCPVGKDRYELLRDIDYGGTVLLEGDMVRLEGSPFDDVIEVKRLVEEAFGGRRHSNILYHLDSENLSNYSSDEIESLYSTGR